MAKLSDSTNIDWVQVQEQGSTPATPSSGYGRIYCKSDGLYYVDDAGTVIGPLVSAAGSGYTQGARVYNSGDIVVANSGWTVLTFDSERYDTDGIHDTGSNTSRLTCQTAGKYLIIGNAGFEAFAGWAGLGIYLNNTTVIAQVGHQFNNADSFPQMVISTIYNLAQTNYVELRANQISAGNKNVKAVANFSPEFMMQRIG